MVLFRFPSMSRAAREDRPQPPSIEEIINDLQSAKASDVAFKPPECFPSLSREKEALGKATGSKKDTLPKQTVSKQHKEESGTSSESAKQDAEVFSKAQEFLEHYESLAASVTKLKGMDDDLKSKEDALTQSIKQVKELWRVENTESYQAGFVEAKTSLEL